jgi:serine/threonine protein phosphatase 1
MLMGNHEQMMIDALTSDYEKDDLPVLNWLENGGTETLAEFCKLPKDKQTAVIDFVVNLPYLSQVKIGIQNYVLVHAGLNVAGAAKAGNVSTAAVLPRQSLNDLVWIREKFFRKRALPRSITVFGHTPIPMIKRQNSAKIWRDKRFNDKIGIDGGCVYGGCLLALRLDDMAEFAVPKRSGDKSAKDN